VNPARQRWEDLPASRQRLVLGVAVFDAGMRAWALLDLKNRPDGQVNGPKAAWGLALTIVNSAGLVPAAYLLFGRRRD
jgi:hypothetical protein